MKGSFHISASSCFLLTSLACLSCQSEEVRQEQMMQLPEDSLASVGAEILGPELLPDSEAHTEEALQELVHDTLLAIESRATHPARATVIERAVLARGIHEKLRADYLEQHPVTPEALEETRQLNWLRFDRPRAVRTVEVFIPVPEMAPDAPYYEMAQKLREQAADAHNLEDLIAVTNPGESEIKVERSRLPPVAADGRVVPIIPQDRELTNLGPEIAQAATSLEHAGEVSSILALEDGYRFLFSLEIVEAQKPEGPEVKEELRRVIAAGGIAPQLRAIVGAGSQQVKYTSRDLASRLALVWRR